MAHVKVKYHEEEWHEDEHGHYSFPEFKFLEGDYKKVKWDGYELRVGSRKIITQELSEYGLNDIDYLEIDGTVYIERKSTRLATEVKAYHETH